jgi:flagellar hook-length control protein FliK
MQIDVISGASVAPESESSPSSSAAGKAHGSFADMLDAVAEDQDDSPRADDSDNDNGDEWMTVPVVVPFVPVVPQDLAQVEEGDATAIEAIGEDTATADALQAEGIGATQVTSLVDGDAPKPEDAKGQDTAAAIDAPLFDAKAAGSTDAEPSDAGTAASIRTGESAGAAASPKADKATKVPVQKTPEVAGVNQASAARTMANDAIQSEVTQKVASNEEATASAATKEPAGAAKGVAARFARALERATEQAVAPSPEAGENNQASNENGSGQPSFGEWLREQLPQLTAPRGHDATNSTFTLVAASQTDARVGGFLASSGSNASSSAPTLPNAEDVNLQIVHSLRMQFRDGIGEAVLKLKPEHLGSVSISLKVENGGLKANVQADMPAVRQWLESQQDTLRSALADHGLRLDRFDVEPDAQRQQADHEGPREQSRKRQTQKREAEQAVFEVVV